MKTFMPWLITGLKLGILIPSTGQIYSDYLGNGHDLGIRVLSSDTTRTASATYTLNGLRPMSSLETTARLLGQATFGADFATIRQVHELGHEAWIDEQLQLPVTYPTEMMEALQITYPADFQGINYFNGAWWHTAMTAPDQLRHRTAFALSQIMVISSHQLEGVSDAVANYYDLLARHALGNYRDLLEAVTYSVAMGAYLSHLNNPRSIPEENIRPDENYAREIMQLFSIGLYELNPDGSYKRDNQGNPIPTYDNQDIREMAKVFTGLGAGAIWEWLYEEYEDIEGPEFFMPLEFINPYEPMAMYEEWHEQGSKVLLKQETIPAGQRGNEDIRQALDFLFNHPNVGPFLGKQLIQRLVKSNPSPDYVRRVATVFNDNGSGVRGDLGAVVKAIILDPEAQNCNILADQRNGRLKEPVIRYLQLLRGIGLTNEIDRYATGGFELQERLFQNILAAPSVFNFYQPGYQPSGEITQAGLVAPEFQILNSVSAIEYVNMASEWTIYGRPMEVSFFIEAENEEFFTWSELQLEDKIALLEEPQLLVDHLGLVLCHGQMTSHTRRVILNTIEQFLANFEGYDHPPEIDYYATLLAINLTMVSPDFVIVR